MTRQLLFAFVLVSTGVLLSASAEATTLRCENRAANCVGGCANFTGGAGVGVLKRNFGVGNHRLFGIENGATDLAFIGVGLRE